TVFLDPRKANDPSASSGRSRRARFSSIFRWRIPTDRCLFLAYGLLRLSVGHPDRRVETVANDALGPPPAVLAWGYLLSTVLASGIKENSKPLRCFRPHPKRRLS